jgi:hypothetical protein
VGRSGSGPDPEERSAPAAGPAGARPEGDERYRCSNCGRAIETLDVVRIDGEHRWAIDFGASSRRRTGYVLITHRCPCSARVVVSRRYGSYAAYLALFGRGMRLPYVSPFRVIDLRDDDPAVTRWRWELEQVDTVDDFVLWVDAERRKAADESRRRRAAEDLDGPTGG